MIFFDESERFNGDLLSIGTKFFLIDLDNTLIFTDRANNLAYEKVIKELFPSFDKSIFNKKDRVTLNTIKENERNLFYELYKNNNWKDIDYHWESNTFSMALDKSLFGCPRYIDYNIEHKISYKNYGEILKTKDERVREFEDSQFYKDPDGISFLSFYRKEAFDIISKAKNKVYSDFLFSTEINKSFLEFLWGFIDKHIDYKEARSRTSINDDWVFEHDSAFACYKIIVTNANKSRAYELLKYHGLIDEFDYIIFCNGIDNKYEFAFDRLEELTKDKLLFENIFIFDDETQLDNARRFGFLEDNLIIVD